MNKLILITLLFVTTVSCNRGSLFEAFDFDEGDKLIFKYLNSEYIAIEDDHEFHKKYGHFYISDINAINRLSELVKEKIKSPSENSKFAYMITLATKDESHFVGIYDLQNEVLFSNSYYKLRIEELEKFSNKFIRIRKYEIRFKSIPSLRKGIKLLKQNNFEVEHYEKIIKSGIINFNGITTVKTASERFSNIENFKSIKKAIRADLNLTNYEYILIEVSTGQDFVEIQFASNYDLINLLPDNYVIIKPYNETAELFPIDAYNIDNVNLKALFDSNNIEYELID